MSQFDELLVRVGPRIAKEDTSFRKAIGASQRLAICLRNCGGLSLKWLRPSSSAWWMTSCLNLPRRTGRALPRAFIIDGISRTALDPSMGNMWSSRVHQILAVVDAYYRFRVIDVGGYGRTSDGGILSRSSFGEGLMSGTLDFPEDKELPEAGHRGKMPYVLVGDEAFPLRRYLMRPFPGSNIPAELFLRCQSSVTQKWTTLTAAFSFCQPGACCPLVPAGWLVPAAWWLAGALPLPSLPHLASLPGWYLLAGWYGNQAGLGGGGGAD
ncbi:hypothetical protein N1851_018864 [Merluccius polli]|uniref:DDE Tnp4 domain-containing protein n=1 Tax=Merluccius polli TaxID=89951 RepID=A0AA47MMB0_MERPO|nr:hypothetical protein N1851_018864 [Merluccius polli]